MDNELFELCRDVYERTQWSSIDLKWYFKYFYSSERYDIRLRNPLQESEIGKYDVPLYTSDYLLEKLPIDLVDDEHEVHAITLYCGKWTKQWFAGYEGYFGGQNEPTDTPLKALLKLVIALDDAGVKL